jgi:DNA invertase Pin-like site-specific DNA recombinase
MKVAIYCRVSTSEQDVTNQLLALEKWARDRGWEIVQVYQEQESAWRSGHQRELVRLKEDVGRQRFEAVLVWALDRLSREGAAAILNLINSLQVYGIKVYSYQEPWTEAPGIMGELLYAITGWAAKMESERRSERTKLGLAKAIALGKTLGRPKGAKDKRRRKTTGYLLRGANAKLQKEYR